LQFFALVLIIFAVEVVGSVLAFVYYPQTETAVLNNIAEYQVENGTEPRNAASEGLDLLQDSVSAISLCLEESSFVFY